MNILLIVSGGIAAYKSIDIVSNLSKQGNNVKVILTENASKFVTELTFQTMSKNHVYSDIFSEVDKSEIQHIDLGKWADKILIAPATANIIAKISNGIADDLATNLILALDKFSHVTIVPAMNTNMYNNPITQGNIFKLRQLGYNFVEPLEGLLACGDIGKGKFPTTEIILDSLFSSRDMINKKVLVTAGATREYIDPVRYITNPASGKMGTSIAETLSERGAEVILVTTNSYSSTKKNLKVINVESAEEMFFAVEKNYKEMDIIIKTAAVSDYTPVITYDKKVKKQVGNIEIEFERTTDILHYLGQRKKKDQVLVGFAAETNNVIDYAKDKIKRKNLDFIVANDVSKKDIGFGSDDNEVYIIDKYFNTKKVEKSSKKNIANIIIDTIIQ